VLSEQREQHGGQWRAYKTSFVFTDSSLRVAH